MTAPGPAGGPVRRSAVARRLLGDLPSAVGVLAAVAFAVALGFGIVAPVIPLFAREFGVGNAAAGAVVSAFALMRLTSALAGGRLVERFGERAVLAAGLAIVAVSSVLAGLAQSYPQLLVLRGVGGVGSAMFTVSAVSLLLRIVRSDQRGRASAWFQGGFLAGGVAGGGLGGDVEPVEEDGLLPGVVDGVEAGLEEGVVGGGPLGDGGGRGERGVAGVEGGDADQVGLGGGGHRADAAADDDATVVAFADASDEAGDGGIEGLEAVVGGEESGLVEDVEGGTGEEEEVGADVVGEAGVPEPESLRLVEPRVDPGLVLRAAEGGEAAG